MGSTPYFLGVDLGGTQMRMAAVGPDGLLATDVLSAPTGPGFGPEDLARTLAALEARVRESLPGGHAAALGVGTAGVVTNGPLTQSPNLPQLVGIDVLQVLRATAGCPVSLENDARCFTLAEARYGSARGARHVCGIALGTGVGAGVVIDGRLHRGAHAQAGEVAGIPLRAQHVEHYVCGAGVVRNYLEAGGRGEGLDAAQVAERARGGDVAARRAWTGFGTDLAFVVETVIALLDPEVVVIGGSLAQAADLYRDEVFSRLSRHPTRVVDAQLGTAAGVIGAAALNIGA